MNCIGGPFPLSPIVAHQPQPVVVGQGEIAAHPCPVRDRPGDHPAQAHRRLGADPDAVADGAVRPEIGVVADLDAARDGAAGTDRHPGTDAAIMGDVALRIDLGLLADPGEATEAGAGDRAARQQRHVVLQHHAAGLDKQPSRPGAAPLLEGLHPEDRAGADAAGGADDRALQHHRIRPDDRHRADPDVLGCDVGAGHDPGRGVDDRVEIGPQEAGQFRQVLVDRHRHGHRPVGDDRA
jgi:hypothetical protein